jgi:hypothetical protein
MNLRALEGYSPLCSGRGDKPVRLRPAGVSTWLFQHEAFEKDGPLRNRSSRSLNGEMSRPNEDAEFVLRLLAAALPVMTRVSVERIRPQGVRFRFGEGR